MDPTATDPDADPDPERCCFVSGSALYSYPTAMKMTKTFFTFILRTNDKKFFLISPGKMHALENITHLILFILLLLREEREKCKPRHT